ncbi:methylmalonyl-CoA mutase family protein [Chloroflexota bacterium]
MFSKETLDEAKEVREQWNKETKRRYEGEEFASQTGSGIPIKLVYSPDDIAHIDFKKNIGMPGVYPYTRGAYPLQYQFTPPMASHGLGFGLPEHTREIWEEYRKAQPLSMRGKQEPAMFLIPDLMTCYGYDPDHPLARGRVGVCGISMSTIEDWHRLYDGIPLDRFNTFLAFDNVFPPLAMYTVMAEENGYTMDQLHGLSHWTPYRHIADDGMATTPDLVFKLLVELLDFATRRMPNWSTISLSGYGFEEGGANGYQQMALMLSVFIDVVEKAVAAGLDPDSFVPKISLFHGMEMDLLEQVAKMRATKRMYAKLVRERFGCKDPRAERPIMAIQCANVTYRGEQPMNNIIRSSFETLAGMLGGASAVWTTPYDEPLGIHTEQAAMLAFRIQQILVYETGVTKVSDPLAGSYYVEWLTDRMEEEATKVMKEIEELGGYAKAWESGLLRDMLVQQLEKYHWEIHTGEKPIVGANIYRTDEKPVYTCRELDAEVEKTAVDRVEKFKAGRDAAKAAAAEKELRKAASDSASGKKSGELMEATIEAARAGCTMGEMTTALNEEFGYGHRYGGC